MHLNRRASIGSRRWLRVAVRAFDRGSSNPGQSRPNFAFITRRMARPPSSLGLRDDHLAPLVETLRSTSAGAEKGAEEGERGGEHLAAPPRPRSVPVIPESRIPRSWRRAAPSTRLTPYSRNELRIVTRRTGAAFCAAPDGDADGDGGRNDGVSDPGGARVEPPRRPLKGRSRHHSRFVRGLRIRAACPGKATVRAVTTSDQLAVMERRKSDS
jgi:hypothetical protein